MKTDKEPVGKLRFLHTPPGDNPPPWERHGKYTLQQRVLIRDEDGLFLAWRDVPTVMAGADAPLPPARSMEFRHGGDDQ